MRKKFLSIFAGVMFLATSGGPVYAKVTPTPSPQPTPTQASRTSYELFWPLVAGKTEGESLYSLKLLKEQISGWFIFDSSKKADYKILLGTKRVLEAEKLLKNGDVKLAQKALERANSNFSTAYDTIKKAGLQHKFKAGEIDRERLINMKSFIDYLKANSPSEVHQNLDLVREKANRILGDYLP